MMKKYMERTISRAAAGSMRAESASRAEFDMEMKTHDRVEFAYHTAMQYYWRAVRELLDARCLHGIRRHYCLERYHDARVRYLTWSELL